MRRRTDHDDAGRIGVALIAVAFVVCLLLHASVAQAQSQSDTYRFDIASQPLANALAEFATVSGVDIAYRQSLATGRRSSPVQGDYPAPVALRMLLQGAGLSARFTGPRAAIIFEPGTPDAPTPHRGPSAAPALRLDMAEVRAPIIVGARDHSGQRRYAMAVQTEIREWLRADGTYQGRAFRLEVRIYVDPQGLIREVAVRRPSGEPAWDDHVVRTLTGRSLSRPPPSDLSEPLAFEVVSDRLPDQGQRRKTRP